MHMTFNSDKYKCLCIRQGNPNSTYKMGNVNTGTVGKEKDLWLTLSGNLNVSEQCGVAASKANELLKLIRKHVVHIKQIIIPLNKSIGAAILVQIWKRATKMVSALRQLI